ncbi:MAG: hypothetical protein BWY52_02988 [Chloroflexi bacterium ADurb.Bin325]|nr:MAG: hypothetical protein BWY52_02988 [Chloroflexi bacterium ADurb.Bin325]
MSLSDNCTCPRGEVIDDLVADDLLELRAGERLWKLYCFREAGHATGLRHRIYTKRKADGRLALVTFAQHNPPHEPRGDGNGAPPEPSSVRSGIARVADLSVADLDRLIAAVRQQMAADACEELDLSDCATLDAQLARLAAQP